MLIGDQRPAASRALISCAWVAARRLCSGDHYKYFMLRSPASQPTAPIAAAVGLISIQNPGSTTPAAFGSNAPCQPGAASPFIQGKSAMHDAILAVAVTLMAVFGTTLFHLEAMAAVGSLTFRSTSAHSRANSQTCSTRIISQRKPIHRLASMTSCRMPHAACRMPHCV